MRDIYPAVWASIDLCPLFVKHKPEYCGLAELAESDFIVLEKRSMRLCSVKQFSRHECDKRERQSGKSLVL